MKNKVMVLATITAALALTTGCAGFRAGINAARVTVNKGFDIVDKAAATVENTIGSAVVGTANTAITVSSSAGVPVATAPPNNGSTAPVNP
jgi:hypothetical protein